MRTSAARHGLLPARGGDRGARGLTAYAVGQMAGVDPGIVKRWLSGVRDIRLATADKLAVALGLRLVEIAPPAARRQQPVPPPPDSRDAEIGS